jgi:glycine cleavage system H protein
MNVPEELGYTSDHEWLRLDDGRWVVGITDFAQATMGDVVHVELPLVGTSVLAGDVVAEIETTKSVSEVYAPVAGTIVNVNEEVHDHPEVINAAPYGAGWLFSIETVKPVEADALLTAAAYESMVTALSD